MQNLLLIIAILFSSVFGTCDLFAQSKTDIFKNKKMKDQPLSFVVEFADDDCSFNYNEISGTQSKTLTISSNIENGCVPSLLDGKFYAQLKMGNSDDHLIGIPAGAYSADIALSITGLKASGALSSNSEILGLSISNSSPEAVDITHWLDLYYTSGPDEILSDKYQIEITNCTLNDNANNDLSNNLNLTIYFLPNPKIHSRRMLPGQYDQPIIEVDLSNYNYFSGSLYEFTQFSLEGDFLPVILDWKYMNNCTDCGIEEFEIQLLKLENIDFGNANNYSPGDYPDLKAIVDWDKATSYTVQPSDPSATFHRTEIFLSDGDGWYTWRVRPIGNYFQPNSNILEGENLETGQTDPRNYGAWNIYIDATTSGTYSPFADGSVLTYSSSTASFGNPPLFYYSQPENDKNWRHQRFFAEDYQDGIKFYNQMTYADHLLNSRQVQSVKLKAKNIPSWLYYSVAQETAPDYSGASVFSTLPAPVEARPEVGNYTVGLEYKTDFANVSSNPINADNFDKKIGNKSFYDPEPIDDNS